MVDHHDGLAARRALLLVSNDEQACFQWLESYEKYANLACVPAALSRGQSKFALALLEAIYTDNPAFHPSVVLTNGVPLICELAQSVCHSSFQWCVTNWPKCVNTRDWLGRTPLFMACAAGQPENIRAILQDEQASVRAMMATGCTDSKLTPLHALARLESQEAAALCFQELLCSATVMREMTARLCDTTSNGETALWCALNRRHDCAVEWMCKLALLATCSRDHVSKLGQACVICVGKVVSATVASCPPETLAEFRGILRTAFSRCGANCDVHTLNEIFGYDAPKIQTQVETPDNIATETGAGAGTETETETEVVDWPKTRTTLLLMFAIVVAFAYGMISISYGCGRK